jgi:hypothetical protein
MFKSLIAINNILLAENGRTIARNKNLLADATNYVCFYNNANNPFGFHLGLENSHSIPHGFSVYLKDNTGLVMFSGSKLTGNTVTLTPDVTFSSLYAHPIDDLTLELTAPTGDVIASLSFQLKIFYSPVEEESALLYRKGVPVNVLDQMSKIFTATAPIVSNQKVGAPMVDVDVIVAAAHDYTPPNYDTVRGAPYFGIYDNRNAITFHLTAYTHAHDNSPDSILNCYDCAAFLQILLSHYTHASHYCYMNPFGYMSLTDLIGRGQCNNPFYDGNGTTAVIASAAPNRTGFGNHAFLRLDADNHIVDSCSGPHIGNEDIDDYILAAVDTNHVMPARYATGTSASVGYYTGVTTVDIIRPVLSNAYEQKVTEGIFNIEHLGSNDANSRKVMINISSLESIMNKAGWKTSYKETVGGQQECLQMLFFEKNNHLFYMRVFAAESNQYAINRLFDLAFNTESEEHHLTKVKGSSYHQHVESNHEGKQLVIIQHYNLVFHIYTSDGKVNLTDLTKVFADSINNSLVPSNIPNDVKVEIRHDKATGQHHVNLLDAMEGDVLEFIDINSNLKVINSTDTSLVFELINREKTSFEVWSINRSNLSITKSKTLPIG